MKTLLVVPCYYESGRLPKFLPRLCEGVEHSGLPIEIQLVDDGSSEEEQSFLSALGQKMRSRYPFVNEPLLIGKNSGKGGAVRAGWNLGGEDADTLAFVDADGAASAEETVRFIGLINQSKELNRVFIATRDSKAGRNLRRKWSRKLVARIFNFLIRQRYDIQVSDTQCGLKAVPKEFFQAVKRELVQEGYAFDLELLLAAKRSGLEIETIPIDWTEIPGSTTNLKHALRFMKQILFREI